MLVDHFDKLHIYKYFLHLLTTRSLKSDEYCYSNNTKLMSERVLK